MGGDRHAAATRTIADGRGAGEVGEGGGREQRTMEGAWRPTALPWMGIGNDVLAWLGDILGEPITMVAK